MALLHVETHREGDIGNVLVSVHAQQPDGDGNVESHGSPTWVRFLFSGKPGARLRVQIRSRDNGAILYREEVQLGPNGGSFDSDDRYFLVDGVVPEQAGGFHKALTEATAMMAEAAAATVDLEIKVSARDGINGYGFAYDGVPVPMSAGKGKFPAVKGKPGRLEWLMRGNPGGTMKVEVLRDGTAIHTREKSTIVPPFGTGLDAFEINIPQEN